MGCWISGMSIGPHTVLDNATCLMHPGLFVAPSRHLQFPNISGRSPRSARSTEGRCTLLQVRRYQPFASGSRNCVGMPQAQVTMHATVATLLARFSFRLADRAGPSAPVSHACHVNPCSTGSEALPGLGDHGPAHSAVSTVL